MEKIKKLKIVLGILLSFVMILTLSNFSIVHADDEAWPDISQSTGNGSNSEAVANSTTDDDPFSNISDGDWSTPEIDNSSANNQANNSSSNLTNSNANSADVTFNVSNTNNTSNNTNSINSTTSNSNSLAKTGIEDSNGMVAVILIVCGIVAVYSFKKINDYKNV